MMASAIHCRRDGDLTARSISFSFEDFGSGMRIVESVWPSCVPPNETGFSAPDFEFSLTSFTDATFSRVEDDSVSEVTYAGFGAGAVDATAAEATEDCCEIVGVLLTLEIVAGIA